jgi:hypothetical protein
MKPGLKWLLRNPSENQPVTFEILRQEGNTFVFRSTTPWGLSEWGLSQSNVHYFMQSYGTGGKLMPLKKQLLYLDFSKEEGSRWSNPLGTLSVVSRSDTVHSKSLTYKNCTQIRHQAGRTSLSFTFAPGVGYVRFGEGTNAFILDEASSVLPGDTRAANSSEASVPPAPPESLPPTTSRQDTAVGAPLVGITPNRFANEHLTAEVMANRFHQTLTAGANFLVGNGKWAELEPHNGRYQFDNLRQFLSAAAGANLPISFNLRVIDTNVKDVPPDLAHRSWSDPRLTDRLMHLLDAIVPLLRGRARWFMFGYEIDARFSKTPKEARDFIILHKMVRERVRALAPDMLVGSTLEFTGIDRLKDLLAPLDQQLDFVALTYCPLQPDFTVRDPSVVSQDIAHIKAIARGRKIVFQEAAYPTSPASHSSVELQAQFYRLLFSELLRDPAAYAAVNFMTLADFSDADTGQYATFYGLPHNLAFRGSLQTLGLFDQHGRAKPSWNILLESVHNLQNQASISK